MKQLIVLAFLLFSSLANAQESITALVTKVDSIFAPKLTGELFVPDSIDGKGEQFFISQWKQADILLSNGCIINGVDLKYNGFLDQVLWFNPKSQKPYVVDKPSISEFWLKDDTLWHFKKINVSDTTASHRSDVFVQVVLDGNPSLYVQRKVTHFVDELVAYKYFKVYEQTPVYYLRSSNRDYLRLDNLDKRSFLNLFPEQKKELTKLIRSHRLNLKKEEDLFKVVQLMNTMTLKN